ncbi:unnamed protein product [Moneuplotes crassus]|uniref:Uncharacterized protein n=1 Tax=Euplotes crassus TaxID=5936 RepID=A0AAD1XZJ7_EUPCR|nr:unnamed protein product [Moneuplotes crassus]
MDVHETYQLLNVGGKRYRSKSKSRGRIKSIEVSDPKNLPTRNISDNNLFKHQFKSSHLKNPSQDTSNPLPNLKSSFTKEMSISSLRKSPFITNFHSRQSHQPQNSQNSLRSVAKLNLKLPTKLTSKATSRAGAKAPAPEAALDRGLISSLSVEDFVLEAKASQYLTDVRAYKNKNYRSLRSKKGTKLSVNATTEDVYRDVMVNRSSSRKKRVTSLKRNFDTQEKGTFEIENLGTPASRPDAANLLKWMNEEIDKVKKDMEKTKSEKLIACQAIYNLAWKELTRQVSVQCVERGILMDKIFKAYFDLINKVYKNLEGQQNETEKTSEMRMSHMKKALQHKIDTQEEEYNKLFTNKGSLEEKLRDLEGQFKQLKEKNAKISHDNYRMKFIIADNHQKFEAMKSDVEYYKFRVKEMSEVSEEEEDAIKKILHKNRPTQKYTDCHDIEKYIEGDQISEYDEEKKELNEKEEKKEKELIKQNKQKFPKTVNTQTDPPPTNNFGVQIKDGQEMLNKIDIRVRSAKDPPKDTSKTPIPDSDEKLPLKRSQSCSIAGVFSTKAEIRTDKEYQKFLSNTDLHKIKTIDKRLHSKILEQMAINQDNFEYLKSNLLLKISTEKALSQKLSQTLKKLQSVESQNTDIHDQISQLAKDKEMLHEENCHLRDMVRTMKENGCLLQAEADEDCEEDYVMKDGVRVKKHQAHLVVDKIKKKRTGSIKMSKASVLKTIARFDDAFRLHKDSERKVLAEIIYEDFQQHYGLSSATIKSVAELKFKRFLKAIRAYSTSKPLFLSSQATETARSVSKNPNFCIQDFAQAIGLSEDVKKKGEKQSKEEFKQQTEEEGIIE